MLRVKGLYHRYKNQRNYTLSNLNFNLAEGSFLSIIGETGCGKTTLLKCIAGFESLTKGRILLDGEKVLGPKEQLIPGHAATALVAQDFNLMLKHNVIDHLEYQLRKFNIDATKKLLKSTLDQFSLYAHRNSPVLSLSGGQQQKLALASAFIRRPKIILLDEPFSHLDIVQAEQIRADLNFIQLEIGCSVIMVTHRLRDAYQLSDQMLVMQGGKILQEDHPSEIYNRPVNEYVANISGAINKIPRSLFSGKKGKPVLVRPSNIELKKGKIARVLSREFTGAHYIYTVKYKRSHFIVYSMEPQFDVGDVVDMVFV